MTDWQDRLLNRLEPALRSVDPRPQISAYHDMPYAVFCYPPEDDFGLREQVGLLTIRLEQEGKRVTTISLAECMYEALELEGLSTEVMAGAEKEVGLRATVETIHHVLSEYRPLDGLVLSRIPPDADPLRDIVFLVRAGALFPVYRISSLLEPLRGALHVPTILFYPGVTDGAAGLRFMGVLEAEHNYRPRIF